MHINQFGNGGTGAEIVPNAFARLRYKYESRNNRNIYIAEKSIPFCLLTNGVCDAISTRRAQATRELILRFFTN